MDLSVSIREGVKNIDKNGGYPPESKEDVTISKQTFRDLLNPSEGQDGNYFVSCSCLFFKTYLVKDITPLNTVR